MSDLTFERLSGAGYRCDDCNRETGLLDGSFDSIYSIFFGKPRGWLRLKSSLKGFDACHFCPECKSDVAKCVEIRNLEDEIRQRRFVAKTVKQPNMVTWSDALHGRMPDAQRDQREYWRKRGKIKGAMSSVAGWLTLICLILCFAVSWWFAVGVIVFGLIALRTMPDEYQTREDLEG